MRWQIYVMSIPASIPLLPQSWRDKALAGIGGSDDVDHDDPMTRMIDAGTKSYVSKRSFPARPPVDDLRRLTVPVYAAMAGDSAVNADPGGTVSFAKSTLPTVDARVWPGATHSLPMEQPQQIYAEMLAFMARHDK
jgi:pimeloyl-ACP methyl ester carboxylesterase